MENGNIGDSLKSSLEYAFTELLEETFPYKQITTSVSMLWIFNILIPDLEFVATIATGGRVKFLSAV